MYFCSQYQLTFLSTMFGRLLFTFLVLAVMPITFYSCGNDDVPDNPSFTANLFYAGNRLSVSKAIIIHYDQHQGEVNSHNWDLWLVSEGITYNASTQLFSGQGELIYVDLNVGTSLAFTGEYNFQTTTDRPSGSFSEVRYWQNYNFNTGTGTGTNVAGIEGVVSIAPNGANYEIEINTFYPMGRILQGTFKGPVEIHDHAPAGPFASTVLVDGLYYRLMQGYLDYYEENDGGISEDYDINLISEGIIYDEEEESFSGTGLIIYFDLNSTPGESFQTGTYTFNSVRNPFSLVVATFTVDKPSGVRKFKAESGSVTAGKTGETWNLEYNFQVQEVNPTTEAPIGGIKTAVGTYVGTLISE
jgi:hypothetical protein